MWDTGQTETAAFWVVHVTVAVYVKGHVLLNKRDVGSSISWIGLAWLSPIIGSGLYALFGVNRVKARAKILRGKTHKRQNAAASFFPVLDGNHLTQFEIAVRRIVGRETVQNLGVWL